MAKLYFTYLVFGVLVFFWGPVSYPLGKPFLFALYLIACYSSLFLGMHLAYRYFNVKAKDIKLNQKDYIFKLVSLISVAVAATTLLSQGVSLDSLADAAINPGEAYYGKVGSVGQSSISTFIYTLHAPLFFIGLALGIQRFKQIGISGKLLFLLMLGTNLSFYIAQGTNFGIFYIAFSALVIYIVCGHRYPSYATKIGGRKKVVLFIIGLIGVSLFLRNLSHRIADFSPRYLLDMPVSVEGWVYSLLPAEVYVPLVYALTYISQGYYGLRLMFDYPFESTYGVGSGYFVIEKMGLYIDPLLFEKTYQSKMDAVWDSKVQWHTALTWIANDVSPYGVPFVLLVFGFVASLVYKSAKINNDTISLSLIPVIFISLVFMPANNILMGNPVMFFSFFSLVALWALLNKVSMVRTK